MKTQHYLGKKIYFSLPLNSGGRGTTLSKTIRTNHWRFPWGTEGAFHPQPGLFGRQPPPPRPSLWLIVIIKTPIYTVSYFQNTPCCTHCLFRDKPKKLVNPISQTTKQTGGRQQVICPKPRAVNNGGGCETGEDDSGPTPHPGHSVEHCFPRWGGSRVESCGRTLFQ